MYCVGGKEWGELKGIDGLSMNCWLDTIVKFPFNLYDSLELYCYDKI